MSQPPTPWLRDSPGVVLALFRDRPQGLTKSDVAVVTGLSRSAAGKRVDLLQAAGYLRALDDSLSTRGRPAERFILNGQRGVMLIGDTGATGMRVALCDAVGNVIDQTLLGSDITQGPEAVLKLVDDQFRAKLRRHRRSAADVLGVGIAVAGPVDHASGKVISPPNMPGWHEYDIPAYFAHYNRPVLVENDANAMVIGEQAAVHPDVEDIVFVKIGTGIGAGLITRGQLYRGANGAAGDIGHIPLAGDDPQAPLCRCNNRGCVEAYASGWALIRDMSAQGIDATSIDDIIPVVRNGNRDALAIVQRAGRTIGAAVSDIVNLVNPSLIVFGGQLAALDDILLANAREVIYHRSQPLATRNLRIEPSRIENPGVIGLARLVADTIYAPDLVDASFSPRH